MFKSRLLVSAVAVVAFLSLGTACSKKGPSSSVSTETTSALKRVHFDFDKYNIRSQDVSILKENASWMKDHSKQRVIVEGHCDERGTNEYNMALGERRAKAARDYLVNLGVSAANLETVSFGEEKPLDTGHDESAWAANRRAEFVLRK